MDRDELLRREDESWMGFVDAFGSVPDNRRDEQGVVPGWSVHDLVWHCGYWTGYVADVLEKMKNGVPIADDDTDWDAFNEEILVVGRGMRWDQVIVQAEANRERARSALLALDEVTDAAVEEFSDETFAHYDEHAAEIRAFVG
jgi:hypothetical protein